MKLTMQIGNPEFPSITAQELKVGQAVQYEAGNGVLRLDFGSYLLFSSDGRATGVSGPGTLAYGIGNLLPAGTTFTLTI